MTHLTPVPPTPPKAYPREELQRMVDRWMEANRVAEATGDWVSTLGACYHDDAIYRWNIGPNEEFVAEGIDAIRDNALGIQMDGFQGWTYPYDRILIDDQQGEVVGFWRQVAPVTRADGSRIEVPGVGGSWFRYGGDLKWSWQRDFFDLGNVFNALGEVAAVGGLSEPVKRKIHTMARGQKLAGHVPLRPGTGLGGKLKMGAALAKIALLGR
ncbi:MAG: hypothetical protein CMN30_18365 [Sandaracinus sp.]|nr:hypothetical protein [Sandaracinus sp.]MAQ16743.1 hypothetical protein [Sandaracinus sp.]|tara:strand:- start:2270 stop:2905 length:636 start_codon:yes stop_codon:yes gene_type:complete